MSIGQRSDSEPEFRAVSYGPKSQFLILIHLFPFSLLLTKANKIGSMSLELLSTIEPPHDWLLSSNMPNNVKMNQLILSVFKNCFFFFNLASLTVLLSTAKLDQMD